MGRFADCMTAVGRSCREFFFAVGQFCKVYITVEPVILIYMVAIFMEVSITSDLMSTKNCLKYTNVTNESFCSDLDPDDRRVVKKETSKWVSYYSACMFAFTLLSSSYVGSWSDIFSRKYTMLIPPVGSIFATIVAILNGYYIDWPIGLILISGFFSGISGGIVAIIASCFGYVADRTSVEQRTKRIVILEAMIFLGATVGMLAGGGINKYVKNHHPELSSFGVVYGVEIILLVVVLLYIIIRIKKDDDLDSAPVVDSPSSSLWYRLFNLNHITDSIKMVTKPRNDGHRKDIILLMVIGLLSYFSISIQSTLTYLFLSSEPLRYDQTRYSYFQGATFAISGVALIVGLPITFKILHVKDTSLAIIGEISKMLGLIVLGISRTDLEVYLCAVLFLFSEFPVPAIRSILSKIVDSNEIGKVFAFMQLLQNLVMLISSQIFNWLWVATYDVFPGTGFEIVAGLQLIAIALLIYLHLKCKVNSSADGSFPYDRLSIHSASEHESEIPQNL